MGFVDRRQFWRITKRGLSKPLRQRGEKVLLVVVIVVAKNRFDRGMNGGGVEVIGKVGGEGDDGGGFPGEVVVVGKKVRGKPVVRI